MSKNKIICGQSREKLVNDIINNYVYGFYENDCIIITNNRPKDYMFLLYETDQSEEYLKEYGIWEKRIGQIKKIKQLTWDKFMEIRTPITKSLLIIEEKSIKEEEINKIDEIQKTNNNKIIYEMIKLDTNDLIFNILENKHFYMNKEENEEINNENCKIILSIKNKEFMENYKDWMTTSLMKNDFYLEPNMNESSGLYYHENTKTYKLYPSLENKE